MTKKKQTDQQLSTKINFWVGLVLLSILVGSILSMLLHYSINPINTAPGKPQSIQMIKVQEVQAQEKPLTWNDAIRQIFPTDEAGKMIRICMTENKRQNKYAINKNTNGSYDTSWCQVNSVHKPKTMTHDEWINNLQQPKFHAQQVRKIYLSQGWGAWVVFNKGLVK